MGKMYRNDVPRPAYVPWVRAFAPATVVGVSPEDEATYRLRFGAVITEIRLARGFETQQAFADALGVNVSSVQRWETGGTLPDVYNVRNISRVLTVDAGLLVDPPDQLSAAILDVSAAASATLRREIVKRSARRTRRSRRVD